MDLVYANLSSSYAWVNVSSGTGSPRQRAVKWLCVCVTHKLRCTVNVRPESCTNLCAVHETEMAHKYESALA